MGTRWFGKSLFSHIESQLEDLPGGQLRQTLTIPPPWQEFEPLFRSIHSALRAGPEMIGFPPAHVTMELRPRTAVYTISLPAVARLPRFMWVRRQRVSRMLQEMGEQQDELNSTYRQLQESYTELEKRVEERTQELFASRAQLEANARLASLGTLAAGGAHELHNPLAGIHATAQLLQTLVEDGDLPEQARTDDSLRKIISESKRCSRIVRGLLQFARDEPTEKWPVNLNETATRATELARHLADEHRVELELTVTRDALIAAANPLQIEQAIVNLINNAIQASPAGTTIEISTGTDQSTHTVRIHDHGSGIDSKTLKRVFEPFFTTRVADGGTGLGLSMAHGIVQAHDGELSLVQSEAGGTVAVLRLPAVKRSEI